MAHRYSEKDIMKELTKYVYEDFIRCRVKLDDTDRMKLMADAKDGAGYVYYRHWDDEQCNYFMDKVKTAKTFEEKRQAFKKACML